MKSVRGVSPFHRNRLKWAAWMIGPMTNVR
jgi:hypothetical protein